MCGASDFDLAAADTTSTHRLSSLFSPLRRPSSSSIARDSCRLSCTSLTSLASLGATPVTMATSRRQRGMSGMIRASRRFAAQSCVLCPNGDVIIVKGGKIVSIRREDQGTKAVFDPCTMAKQPDTKSDVEVQAWHTGVNTAIGCDDKTVTGQSGNSTLCRYVSLEGSDDVFDDNSSDVIANGDLLTDSLWDMMSEVKRLLSGQSQNEDFDSNSLSHLDNRSFSSGQTEWDEVCSSSPSPANVNTLTSVEVDSMYDEICNRDVPIDHRQEKVSGGIFNIDEDNNMLNVMPLTPLTRTRLTHSDLNLDKPTMDKIIDSRICMFTKQQSFVHKSPSVEQRLKHSSSDFDVRLS